MLERANLDWLIAKVRDGEEIENMVVDEVNCIDCGRPLIGTIQSTGGHRRDCPWNYYFSCRFCDYQSNLAKYTSKTYRCVCCVNIHTS